MATVKWIVKWVVRVINDTKDTPLPHVYLECLRHPGGLITVHEGLQGGDQRQVFDIHRPSHITISASKNWAEGLASRLKSFGVNAAAAPEWNFRDDLDV